MIKTSTLLNSAPLSTHDSVEGNNTPRSISALNICISNLMTLVPSPTLFFLSPTTQKFSHHHFTSSNSSTFKLANVLYLSPYTLPHQLLPTSATHTKFGR